MEFYHTKDLDIVYQGTVEMQSNYTFIHHWYYGCIAQVEPHKEEGKGYYFIVRFTKNFDRDTLSIHQYDRQINKALKDVAHRFIKDEPVKVIYADELVKIDYLEMEGKAC